MTRARFLSGHLRKVGKMMTKTTLGQTFFSLVLALTIRFPESALAQVKIGVGAPISGSSAAFGAQLKNGVEQAVADINSKDESGPEANGIHR